MSFLRFLRDKGLSESVIVEATIWQQESASTLLSQLKSHPHISSEMLFSLIDASSETGQTLEQIQHAQKIIPAEYYQDCIEAHEKSLNSIASYLVEQGHMKLEDYESSLLEYMANRETSKLESSTLDRGAAPTDDSSEMISDAALESLRELVGSGGLDESTITELETKRKK